MVEQPRREARDPLQRDPDAALPTLRGPAHNHADSTKPEFLSMADDGPAPVVAAKHFDEPKREVDDDRLDVYERAAAVLKELKGALPPSATDDIERLLGRINAAYWEVCGVPENEVTPAPARTEKPAP
jgi:hypothetical protein